jgi:hypothetical protein
VSAAQRHTNTRHEPETPTLSAPATNGEQ